jgi:hypothetical protein
MNAGAMPRLEDTIRKLCLELLAQRGDEESEPKIIELREALHKYTESLRQRFAAYPFLVERRKRDSVGQPSEPNQEDSVKEPKPGKHEHLRNGTT